LSIVLSEEQVDFQKTVRAFLEAKITEDLVRRVAAEEVSTDEPLWESFAELELHGLGIPEEHGGAGGSWVELGLVLEEMGAVLVPVPYFATTVLAGQALAAFAPDGQIEEWLERIRKGELVATLALPGRDGWDDDAISVEISIDPNDGLVCVVPHEAVSFFRTPEEKLQLAEELERMAGMIRQGVPQHAFKIG